MIARCRILCLIFGLVFVPGTSHGQLTELAEAERLLLRGNYAESEAAYAALVDILPVQATLGLTNCHWQQGQLDKASGLLDRQLADTDESAPLHAQRAWLALQTGNWDDCRKHVQQALSHEPDNVHAAWVSAELRRVAGEIKQACEGYQKLAQQYDQFGRKRESPRELSWYALALGQHARFNQDQSRFRELTTELYPRILSLNPNYWPAHYETGRLLLEKFNSSDAESAFNDALQINPQAADVHTGLARLALGGFDLDRVRRLVSRALKTNPHHLDAQLCQADMQLASLQPSAALKTLQTARQANPHHAATLGRLSATVTLLDSNQRAQNHAEAEEVHKAAYRAGNQGEYHAAKGEALEIARRYPQAGVELHHAIEAMPQLLGARGQLGMIEMRLGHESKARELLEESFRRDPYNVRVKNQLEVLDLLESYTTLETKHFIIRYDANHDESLARHMAREAERCYADLAATFAFELPEKALLEVFRDGQGVTARQWFAARMVGLPNIHTIAACGGNIVALVSPEAEGRRLNWADILRHEIVHLINLQQTDYAVPNWLTEGCAVWQEKRARRPHWNKLLVQRVPRGDVFNLDSINLGFLKPRSAEDYQLAYCQAELYVNLIARKHGVEGVRNLLAAHRDNLPTDLAIERSLGTTKADLEADYAQELTQIAAELAEQSGLQPDPKLAELSQHWDQNPTDYQAGAKLALARLRRGDYPGAGRLAREVLQAEPSQPLARLVKAKLLTRIGDERAAQAELQKVVDVDSPLPEALKLLAGIHLRQGDLDEAKRLYQRGADVQPEDLQWTKALTLVALRQQNTTELNRLLVRIASAEPDNLVARKKLLQLSKTTADTAQIKLWAREVLHIEPSDTAAMNALEELRESNP